jgi:hypothetical protein
MDIDLKFGALIVNFKPDSLLKVLDFIKLDQIEELVEVPGSGDVA